MVVRVGINEPFCAATACVCAGKDAPRHYEWLRDVAHGAGVDLHVTYCRLEDQLASALQRGEIDAVIAKAWTALCACHVAGMDYERVCDIPLPNGRPSLTGVFIALVESDLHSISDVAGKRLGTGRRNAYENFHAVDRVLRRLEVQPLVRQSYDCCVHAAVSVLEGDTDAAVVSNYCVHYGLDEIVGQPGVFRTIGETAPIPFATFAVSTRLSPDLRSRLKGSLLGTAASGTPSTCFPGGLCLPADWMPEELERV